MSGRGVTPFKKSLILKRLGIFWFKSYYLLFSNVTEHNLDATLFLVGHDNHPFFIFVIIITKKTKKSYFERELQKIVCQRPLSLSEIHLPATDHIWSRCRSPLMNDLPTGNFCLSIIIIWYVWLNHGWISWIFSILTSTLRCTWIKRCESRWLFSQFKVSCAMNFPWVVVIVNSPWLMTA